MKKIFILSLVLLSVVFLTGCGKKQTNQTQQPKSVQPSVTQTDPISDTKNWPTYSSSNLRISFQYPINWFVKEDESINRVYIHNTQNEINKGTTPADFQRVWISTLSQEEAQRMENNTKIGNYGNCRTLNANSASVESICKVEIGTIKNNNLSIRTYKFISEGGPVMQAYWEDSLGKKYFATNASEVGDTNQQKMIENLEKILATIKFIDNDFQNKFTSKNTKLSFSYEKSWICKEVVNGQRVDCYPESRISEEYDAGLDQDSVYMPNITMQISGCTVSKTLPKNPDNVMVNSYIKNYNDCNVLLMTEYSEEKLDRIIKP